MAEFTFNARQYFDFSQVHDDVNSDSYFETTIEAMESHKDVEVVEENGIHEMSDTESDCFFSPVDETPNAGINSSTLYLKSNLRRSLSLNNVLTEKPHEGLSHNMEGLSLNNQHVPERGMSRASSKDHINRLAQPKRFNSHNNLVSAETMTFAEAVRKFQAGTPKRFRSKMSPKTHKSVPLPWGVTKPQSPKLTTTKRVRPVTAMSEEERQQKEIEEARKFKIKALPLNKKILKGPLKPQIEKKPSTVTEPFKLTEAKKIHEIQEQKPSVFKAQPLPKSLHNPFKIQANGQPPTKAQSPNFSKRLSKIPPNKVIKSEKNEISKPFKPTQTQVMPFSFEKRDQQLMKKKEEFINKVLEEEKKAREFHARPPPKAILRPRNSSEDLVNESVSVKSFKRSTEELDTTVFKARPATVLTKKPFEPKRDENHVVKIDPFQLSTDQRLQARQKFEQKLKEKEALAEEYRKHQEEMLKKQHEEEVARIRKQMEYKAQPIKKYKELHIQPSHKATEPISPKFHTDRIRNKENLQQQ